MLVPNKTGLIPGKNIVGIGVGAFILNSQGQVLLMHRPKSIAAHRTTTGMWSVPGGAIDFGESAEKAIKREVYEELGVKINIKNFISYSDQVLGDAHWISLHFLCQIKSGTPKIMEPNKCEKLDWFDPKDPPKNSGITHVLRPAFLLGFLSKAEFKKRKKSTKES